MSASAAIYPLEIKSAVEIEAYDLEFMDLTKFLRLLASIIISKHMTSINDCKQTAPIERSSAIQQCLSQWWKCVQYTDINYMHAPQFSINKALLQLANSIAAEQKVLPLSLLMPTIAFTPALTAITATELDQLKTSHFVLDDKGESIIEVSPCLLWLDANLERFSVEQLASHNRDRLCHTVITNLTHRPLSDAEAARVINHSKEAKQFYEAMIRMLEYKKCSNSLGGKIDYLITQLRKGGQSANRGGTASFPGADAVDGIGAFNKYLASMPETTRHTLFALQAADGPTLTFGERWVQLITGEDVCVEQTADAFQAILTKSPNLYDPNPYGSEVKETKAMSTQQDSLGNELRAKWQQAKHDFQAIFATDKYCVTATYGNDSDKRLAENLYTQFPALLIENLTDYPLLLAVLGNLDFDLARHLLHSIPADRLRAMTPTLRDMVALAGIFTDDQEPLPEDVALFISDQNWLQRALQNADDLFIALQYASISTQILTSKHFFSMIQRRSKLDFFIDVLPKMPTENFFEYFIAHRIDNWMKIIIARPNTCAAFKALYDQFETDQERIAFLAHFDTEWYFQLILAFDFNKIRDNLQQLLSCSLLDENIKKAIFDRLSAKCWGEILNDRDAFHFISRHIPNEARLAFLTSNFSPKLQQLLLEYSDLFLENYIDFCPTEQVLDFLDQHDPAWIKQTIKTLNEFLILYNKIPADKLEKYQAYFPDMDLINLNDLRNAKNITPWLEHLRKRRLVSAHLLSFYNEEVWLWLKCSENAQFMILVLDCLPDNQKYPFCRQVLALAEGPPLVKPHQFLLLLDRLNPADRRKLIKAIGGLAHIRMYAEEGSRHLILLGTEKSFKRKLQESRKHLDSALSTSLQFSETCLEVKRLPRESINQCQAMQLQYRNQLLQRINIMTSIINTSFLDLPANQLISQLNTINTQLDSFEVESNTFNDCLHWARISQEILKKHFNKTLHPLEILILFREEERLRFFLKWLQEGYLNVNAVTANLDMTFALSPKNTHDNIAEIFFSKEYVKKVTESMLHLYFTEEVQNKTRELTDIALRYLPLNRRLKFINVLLSHTSNTSQFLLNDCIFARICIDSLERTGYFADSPFISWGFNIIHATDEYIAASPLKLEDKNIVLDFQVKAIKLMLAPDNLNYKNAYTKAFDRLPPNAVKLRAKAEIFCGLLTLVAAVPLAPFCTAAALTSLALGFILTAHGITHLFSAEATRLCNHSQWFFYSLKNHQNHDRDYHPERSEGALSLSRA